MPDGLGLTWLNLVRTSAALAVSASELGWAPLGRSVNAVLSVGCFDECRGGASRRGRLVAVPAVESPFDAPDDYLLKYEPYYPDVAAAGSVLAALQAEADRAGYGFTAGLTDAPGWRRVAAKVTDGFRSSQVLMGQGERSFIVDCWAGGVWMATGLTRELPEVAGVAHSWLQAPRVLDLVTQWPFLGTWELAEAHERGEAIPVRWRHLRARAAGDPQLRGLVEAAHEQPRLRALSPGTSMWWLTFSRRAAPPISGDLPRVRQLSDGRYQVRFDDSRLDETDSAAQAIAMVVGALPDDAVPDPSELRPWA